MKFLSDFLLVITTFFFTSVHSSSFFPAGPPAKRRSTVISAFPLPFILIVTILCTCGNRLTFTIIRLSPAPPAYPAQLQPIRDYFLKSIFVPTHFQFHSDEEVSAITEVAGPENPSTCAVFNSNSVLISSLSSLHPARDRKKQHIKNNPFFINTSLVIYILSKQNSYIRR